MMRLLPSPLLARRLLPALFLCSIYVGAASADDGSQVWPTTEWETSTPEEQGMDSKELAKLIDFGGYQGIDNILIVRHGKIVTEAYYAPFKAGVKHTLHSVTKSVTGSLIAITLKSGLLDSLTHPVLDFFSDRKIANMDQNKRAITIQNLLDMTSGIDWSEPYAGKNEILSEMTKSSDPLQFILDRPMAGIPGARFNYNSGNAHILSAIITKLTGKSALEFARKNLFAPLGITDVFWGHDPSNITLGYAGLYLQPRDMARFGYLYLRGGVWSGNQILPTDWVDTVSDASIDTNDGWATDFHYANLFWSIPDREEYMASGYHGQRIIVLPSQDIVAVITGTQESYADTLLGYILGSIRSNTSLPPNPDGAALLASRIRDAATEKPSPIGTIPETAKIISGKVYRFGANPLRLNSISFNLSDVDALYEYEYNSGQSAGLTARFRGPVGLDGVYRTSAPTKDGFISAAKGAWVDDSTFVLTRQTLGNDDLRRWLLMFDGKKLRLISEGADDARTVLVGETTD
jgi:CubicO group peptidase (beta-lactamase class C family)